jgi:acetoin utilization deacetylase AcuC-like enzyme
MPLIGTLKLFETEPTHFMLTCQLTSTAHLFFLFIFSVFTGKSRNAFCVVRPLGHHAGVNGLLEGGESCGFCIFNNVAAGAMHALAEYKDICQRVAIVDIDVHHGNGTEEIVRKCNDPSTLFFFSIHLFDNDEVTLQSKKKNHHLYKFYPGTGCNDDLAMNIINVPILPLWKDVHSKSTSMEPKTHNTRKKLRSNTNTSVSQQEANNDDSSEPSTPQVLSTATSSRQSDGESSTATTTQQLPSYNNMVPMTTSLAGTILTLPGRNAYRQAITSRLLPSLRAFNPNLILISAGFDASSGDVGNARHEKDRERMGMDLSPDDYAWTTRQILQIADICCQGRVVSVLEGGYGRTPLSETTTAAATAQFETSGAVAATTLDRQIFGECAIRHLHAFIDPYDVEQRFV